jgi:hypothetical protein
MKRERGMKGRVERIAPTKRCLCSQLTKPLTKKKKNIQLWPEQYLRNMISFVFFALAAWLTLKDLSV